MGIRETFRGRIRTPKEVELDTALDWPVGSEVHVSVVPAHSVLRSATLANFKRAAGSWKDISEEFINKIYADRHFSTRDNVIL